MKRVQYGGRGATVQSTDQKNLERVKAAKPPLLRRSKNSRLGYNFRGGVPVIFLLNGSGMAAKYNALWLLWVLTTCREKDTQKKRLGCLSLAVLCVWVISCSSPAPLAQATAPYLTNITLGRGKFNHTICCPSARLSQQWWKFVFRRRKKKVKEDFSTIISDLSKLTLPK